MLNLNFRPGGRYKWFKFFMNQMTLISVVIVNYNRRDDLRIAIKSVLSQDYQNIEIIVVDNASSDGSLEMLETEFPAVKSVPLPKNIGMDGYSVAFRAAQGGIVFQMDNDSQMPDTTVLGRIAKAFDEVPDDVAVLATRVEEYRRDSDNIEDLRKRDLRRGPLETDGYHSGGAAFRRSLMQGVGYYNQDVFLYGAELFLQLRVLAAGFKLRFYPDILMLHKSSKTARSGKGVYYETRNRYWLFRHYGTGWQQVKHLPWILLHDLVYIVHRRMLIQWMRALIDGFGKLPDSLTPPLRSREPLFLLALDKIGRSYSVSKIVERTMHRLSRKRRLNGG